jgi:hypothetical protein
MLYLSVRGARICKVFNENLEYVFAGGHGLSQIGFSSQDLVGKTVKQFFKDDSDIDEVIKAYRAALDGNPSTFERNLHGTWHRVSVVPLHDNHGKKEALVVSFNIEQLKQA